MNKYYLYTFLILLSFSCANPIAPTGGVKDETPPKVVTEDSTPNFLTNFNQSRIEITFDEWVKVGDVFNQVLISPPLEKNPTIVVRGKTVRVDFDKEEAFRPNTTYTINFGESVKDLTEGNVPPNLKYVFSTGNKIDSLSVQGKVVDIQGKPVKDALFMLYENTADSVVRTERPYYFAKADKEGNFKIENVKEGTFKYFALVDGNLNYKFDLDTEMIGFSEEKLVLNDSTSTKIELQMFMPVANLKLYDSNYKTYGRVNLHYNQNAEKALPIYEDIFENKPYEELDKDSLKIWYSNPKEDQSNWQILATETDTIKVKFPSKTTFLEKEKTLKTAKPLSKNTQLISPVFAIEIDFKHPIAKIDTSTIYLLEDTLQQRVSPTVFVDSIFQRKLKIAYNWKPNKPYQLLLTPSALEDIFGLQNDSILLNYQTRSLKDYGTIKLSLNELKIDQSYFFELLDSKGNIVKPKELLLGKTAYNFEFKQMDPDEYQVKITEDLNGNGEWDTGDYDKKLQPERVFIKKLEALRKNWELEASVAVKFEEK